MCRRLTRRDVKKLTAASRSNLKAEILGSLTAVELLILRQEAKHFHFNSRRLQAQNLQSNDRIVVDRGPIVSLTTFGQRLQTVHLAIESIGLGSVLPSRIILWIADRALFEGRPDSLRRLESRGLEVKLSEAYGPHTKYFPFLQSETVFEQPLITADDDVIYSKWWLAGLITAYEHDAQVLNCYRAHRIEIENGKLARYRMWSSCRSTEPSFLHFTTGVSGCLYPPAMLTCLKESGDVFLNTCPRADDVWLNVTALRRDFKVKQVLNRPVNFPLIAGTQSSGLWQSNVLRDQNDVQLAATYTEQDVARLVKEEPSDGPAQRARRERWR